jgi:hypothetical protein
MTSNSSTSAPTGRSPLVEWLLALNAQVSGWAASVSWWRLIFLGLVVLIASSAVGELLDLRHDKVRIAVPPGTDPDQVTVHIGGKDGIRIEPRSAREAAKPPSAKPQAPGAPATPGADADPDPDPDADDEDALKPRMTTKRVWTFRGLLGDLVSTVLVLMFCYLAAAKIVVRKVAQADEKVRSAVSAAEREAVERQLVQAKLQVLQAQVEPHFLFNTLSAVDYLIETDPARASQMQKKLITYLRGALPQMREEASTLGREVRLIQAYLDLIKMRVEDRLEYELLVPQPLESAEFPPMMLQSLVENAIKHGIEPKPEGGRVSVGAKLVNGMLWVEVRDTGVGIVDPEQLEAPTSGSGIGLQNIRERLAVLYPGKGRLTLMSDDRLGTVVRIGIPYQTRGEEKAAPAKPQEKAA